MGFSGTQHITYPSLNNLTLVYNLIFYFNYNLFYICYGLTIFSLDSTLGSTLRYVFFPLLLDFLVAMCLMHTCILLIVCY